MSLAPTSAPGTASSPAQGAGEVPRVGLGTLAVLVAFYLACLAVVTYPAFLSLPSALPNLGDPLQQLWLMRWWKGVLLEGRSPFIARGVEYPVGAPLGNFSPIPLQAAAYLILSAVSQNDILIYNLLWILGFLVTGLGTFFLARWVVADLRCAAFAGLAAMLSGPMLLHGHGHLELVFVGFIPIFLLSWIGFVDQPTKMRLAGAASSYLIVAASAVYFGLFAVFPAAFYVAWESVRSGWRGTNRFALSRGPWLLGFVALVGPGLFLIYASQIFSTAQGEAMARSREEFFQWGAPLWSYLVPTRFHALGQVMPFDVYQASGKADLVVELGSYFGIVTWLLISYAALGRAGMRKGAFWWWTLALLVLLSLGAFVRVGRYRIDLPAFWLRNHFLPFRFIRVPARFNLLAAVCAAVVAAAGLQRLLGRIGRPSARWLVYAVLVALAVSDLAMVPFPRVSPRSMPGCYRAILARDPAATFLDAPVVLSEMCLEISSCRLYWQSFHGAPTSAGYSGRPNRDYDERLVDGSPFALCEFADPDFLKNDLPRSYGIVHDLHFLDGAWLYLHTHGFRYVVLPRWHPLTDEFSVRFDRLEAVLRQAQVYSSNDAVVYNRAFLPTPQHPTMILNGGFHLRRGWPGPPTALLERCGRLVVFNSDAGRPLQLCIQAQAFRKQRTVRLLEDTRELARWTIDPQDMHSYSSPPFRLEAGTHRLQLESDGEERPKRRYEAIAEDDRRPYSLLVRGVRLSPSYAGATMK